VKVREGRGELNPQRKDREVSAEALVQTPPPHFWTFLYAAQA
jgi:hypothetical protein